MWIILVIRSAVNENSTFPWKIKFKFIAHAKFPESPRSMASPLAFLNFKVVMLFQFSKNSTFLLNQIKLLFLQNWPLSVNNAYIRIAKNAEPKQRL